ncbi:hypothetical protein DFR50_112126 [Roseiarcus fermentans]|uniref:Uncharacterized protein n=1 Tax=Roseiarcus fermentans TaxID=1473586 RepID=A0A366FHF1_9HYPH|nr:hypothetical protein [Roseiarcus fermentans]RBP13155.1 hypothetical protein DFR50_112126 [Roseiarcus fermentans]
MTEELKRVPPSHLSDRDRAINRVADAVHRANEAIQRAVTAGVSVELVRVSRHHDGAGAYGDQMIPMVREPPAAKPDAAEPDAA